MSRSRRRKPIDEPEAVSVDPEAQQQELEAAGWERVYRQDKLLWQHPKSHHLYPQGSAVQRLVIDKRLAEEGKG